MGCLVFDELADLPTKEFKKRFGLFSENPAFNAKYQLEYNKKI